MPSQPAKQMSAPLSFFLFLLFLARRQGHVFYFHFKEVVPFLRNLLTNFLSPELLEQGPKAPVVHLCRRCIQIGLLGLSGTRAAEHHTCHYKASVSGADRPDRRTLTLEFDALGFGHSTEHLY
uniref:Secreted protein n=1 Tax=Rhipicephalus zambeziensis TaxID=60191 RepID=A0A224YH14_9ACAR